MEAVVSGNQACLALARPAEDPAREVDTPWGRLAFETEFMPRGGIGGRQTADVEVETALGPAMLSLHLELDRDGVPSHLDAGLTAGKLRWLEPVGRPLDRDGRTVAWSHWMRLRLSDSRPEPREGHDPSLSDADAPREAWKLGMFPPPVDDAVLEADVAAATLDLLERAAAADPGYAARAYAAMMADAVREAAVEAEDARVAYLRACHARDRLDSAVRAAEDLARGRAADPARYPAEARTELGELRGFASDAPAYDPEDLDEVVVAGPSMVHLETMSDTSCWMGIYLPDGRRVSVRMNVDGGRLVVGADVED